MRNGTLSLGMAGWTRAACWNCWLRIKGASILAPICFWGIEKESADMFTYAIPWDTADLEQLGNYTLPMTGLNNLCYGKPGRLPAFFRGTFAAREKRTALFIWRISRKDLLWSTIFNLGRFWNIGPSIPFTLADFKKRRMRSLSLRKRR